MVTIEAPRGCDPAAWRGLVASLGGTPYHLPEVWGASAGPEAISCLVWKRGGEPVAVAVGLSMGKKLLGFLGGRTLTLPVAPCIASGSDGLRAEVYERLLSFARSERYEMLTVDPRWGDDVSDLPLLQGAVNERLVEFTVDLRADLEEIARGLHKKHRKNVRFAEEQGLELVEDRSLESFLDLRNMQQSSSERASERGNIYGVQDEGFYRRSWESVYRHGPGNVLFARKDGKNVAALAWLAFDRRAVTVRSGSTEEGYKTCAMYLLQFELFRRLKALGIEELNIGGVPEEAAEPDHPQHGLFNYKRYYGGTLRRRTGFQVKCRER